MKFDPIGGDIEEVETLIRFHKRKLAADERDAARYDPEFIEQGILNSIADHNRELKKLTAKLARLKKRKGNPVTKKSNLDFHTRLIHELTALDRRASTKRGYNPNALGIMFGAAENVTDAESFADAFTPTRGMHKVAKNLGLPLDVEKGQWVILRESNPVTKKKTKRKATPAQLRALAKGRATAARNRKRKAPKRKKVARRNPAYANYSKARSVARGTRSAKRGVNPVRKLSPVYVIGRQKFRGVATEYWDGVFWGVRNNAAQWTALTVVKRIANSVANATGRPVSIFDIRK